MWSLRNTYLYLVCLISIVLIIIGLITFAHSVTDIFLTEEYYPTKLERMTQYNKDMSITKEQFEAQVERETEQYKINTRNRNIKNSVKSLSFFIIALPFYIYHWRKIESSQTQVKNPEISA